MVSCPCALVLSVPLTFFSGIGRASRDGILVKGADSIERMADVSTMVFDKTGTLTKGVLVVTDTHLDSDNNIDKETLLSYVASLEAHSMHPIARALTDAVDKAAEAHGVREIAGKGVIGIVEGHTIIAGNASLMDDNGIRWRICEGDIGTIIHVAIDGRYAGHVIISDKPKEDAREFIDELHRLGTDRIIMLSGDQMAYAERVSEEIGIDETHAELLPEDKLRELESIANGSDSNVAFVGDGMNDAPALSRADVGIVMGGIGSDVAIESADIIIMNDRLTKISDLITISRRTVSIARQNIVFAIAVKVLILVLALFGYAPMWLAVFGDVGVMVLCVLNASRTLR